MITLFDKGLRAAVFLALIIVNQPTQAQASLDAQQLQTMRTLSYSVVCNALIYYNQAGKPYDEDNATALHQDQAQLLALVQRSQEPLLINSAQQMRGAVVDLKNLPQSLPAARQSSAAYSRWLRALIDNFKIFDQTLSDSLGRAPDSSLQPQLLNSLSHDIADLALSYQMASFQDLGADVWLIDEDSVVALDASISQRFEQLATQSPALAAAVAKPQRDYVFVRKTILKPVAPWAPNAVGRYLLNASRQLDELAASH